MPIWLAFDWNFQASPHSGNTGWRAGQTVPTPTPTPVISAGLKWHGAAAWHSAGYKGRGVKISKTDTGFADFNPLPGSESPPAGNRRPIPASGQTNQRRPSYAPSQGPRRYQFRSQRRDLPPRPETQTKVAANSANAAAPAFSYSSVPASSGPAIALAGLADSYIAGDTAAFSVTLSALTPEQSYAVTFASSHSSVGFNFRCNYLPTGSFAAAGRAKTLSFTLHACGAPGGTITAQLRAGDANGAIVATAAATVPVVAAAGSLSPVPVAITVGHDQTFALTTGNHFVLDAAAGAALGAAAFAVVAAVGRIKTPSARTR